MNQFPLDALRRWPDLEADNLFAIDAADRLILDQAAAAIGEAPAGTIVTVGDRYGALTLGAVSLGASDVRSFQDPITAEQALANNFVNLVGEGHDPLSPPFRSVTLDEETFRDAHVVLMQLPKDLGELALLASMIQRQAAPTVQVFAGGRIKFMTPSMNTVLAESFGQVRVSLARQKSRVLHAESPLPLSDDASHAMNLAEHYDAQLGLWVCSFPGAFAANKVDIGTRFLLQFLGEPSLPLSHAPLHAADLGSGTGLLATSLLLAHPELSVLATDRSLAATLSTTATIKKNLPDAREGTGPGEFQVRRDNGLSQQPAQSLDLIVCNPPFHSGGSLSVHMADALFADAARTLRPGGKMLTVFNSHLPHRQTLERLIGPTRQLGRNPKFTVTETVAR